MRLIINKIEEINIDEVINSIKLVKVGKAPGFDFLSDNLIEFL